MFTRREIIGGAAVSAVQPLLDARRVRITNVESFRVMAPGSAERDPDWSYSCPASKLSS